MFPFKRLTLIVLFSSMLLSNAWASCADLVLPPPRNTATQNIAAAANQASQEALKDELHKALRFAATANTYPGSTKEGKAYLAFLRQNQTFILQHLGRAFWEARRDAFDDLHGPLARKTVAPIAPEIEQWFDEVIVTKYAPSIFRKTNLWQERLQKSAPKQGLEPSDLGKDVNHYFTSFVRWQRDKAKLGQYLHFTPASPASRGAFSLSSSLEGAVKTGLVWQRFNMIYAPLLEDHYPLLFQSMAQQRKLFAQQNSFHDLAALFNKIINSSYDLYVWAKHNGGIYVHRDAESNRFWLNDQKAAALDPAEYVERLPQIYNLYLQRLGELLQQNGLPFVYEGPENIAQHFTNRPGETIAEQALINNGTGRLVMDVAYDHPIIRPTEDEPGVHFLSNRFNIDPASITHPDLRPLKYLIDHVTQLMRDISVMAVRHLQIEIGNLDYPITRNAIAGKYLTYATTTLGLAHTHGKERRISIDALAIFQHPYTTIGTVAHELQHLAEGQNDYLFFLEAPEGFLHIDDGYKTKFRIDEASARLAQAKLLIELLQKERKASTFAPAATAAGPTSSLTDTFLAHTPQATLLAEQQRNLQQLPHSILDYLKQADQFNFVGRHILQQVKNLMAHDEFVPIKLSYSNEMLHVEISDIKNQITKIDDTPASLLYWIPWDRVDRKLLNTYFEQRMAQNNDGKSIDRELIYQHAIEDIAALLPLWENYLTQVQQEIRQLYQDFFAQETQYLTQQGIAPETLAKSFAPTLNDDAYKTDSHERRQAQAMAKVRKMFGLD